MYSLMPAAQNLQIPWHMQSTQGPRKNASHCLWCHILLNKRHADFSLVPFLIGRGGQNMKTIFQTTGAKTRILGQGSGHNEAWDMSTVSPRPVT